MWNILLDKLDKLEDLSVSSIQYPATSTLLNKLEVRDPKCGTYFSTSSKTFQYPVSSIEYPATSALLDKLEVRDPKCGTYFSTSSKTFQYPASGIEYPKTHIFR